jgi:hypothetical protein
VAEDIAEEAASSSDLHVSSSMYPRPPQNQTNSTPHHLTMRPSDFAGEKRCSGRLEELNVAKEVAEEDTSGSDFAGSGKDVTATTAKSEGRTVAPPVKGGCGGHRTTNPRGSIPVTVAVAVATVLRRKINSVVVDRQWNRLSVSSLTEHRTPKI